MIIFFRKNTLLGYAEPLESTVHVLQEVEDICDKENIQAIRNIRFSSKPKYAEKTRRSRNKVSCDRERRVLEHLQGLFERSTQHGSEKEKRCLQKH